MNLGKIRTYLFRVLPLLNGCSLLMVWAGIPMNWCSVGFLVVVAVCGVWLDARWMIKQEQELMWRKNPVVREVLDGRR